MTVVPIQVHVSPSESVALWTRLVWLLVWLEIWTWLLGDDVTADDASEVAA